MSSSCPPPVYTTSVGRPWRKGQCGRFARGFDITPRRSGSILSDDADVDTFAALCDAELQAITDCFSPARTWLYAAECRACGSTTTVGRQSVSSVEQSISPVVIHHQQTLPIGYHVVATIVRFVVPLATRFGAIALKRRSVILATCGLLSTVCSVVAIRQSLVPLLHQLYTTFLKRRSMQSETRTRRRSCLPQLLVLLCRVSTSAVQR